MVVDFSELSVPRLGVETYINVAYASPVGKPRYSGVYEMCSPVETQIPPSETYISPGVALFQTAPSPKAALKLKLVLARVSVIEQPNYGVVTLETQMDRDTGPIYHYVGNEGVVDGTEDRVVFLVEVGGRRFKVTERLIFGFNMESIDCKGEDFYVRRISSSGLHDYSASTIPFHVE
jgi:hypothetical protein